MFSALSLLVFCFFVADFDLGLQNNLSPAFLYACFLKTIRMVTITKLYDL